MDKITKFLNSLNDKEREAVLLVLLNIKKDFRKIPGIVKLSGYQDLYRVRVGRYRIILRISQNASEVIEITKRDEQTYKDL